MTKNVNLPEKLKSAILKKNLAEVKKLISGVDPSILNHNFSEFGNQKLYSDHYQYNLIHLAIQNRDLPMIQLLAEAGASPNVYHIKESDFNSRADQFMRNESRDLIQWARYCNCHYEIIDFLPEWKSSFKK